MAHTETPEGSMCSIISVHRLTFQKKGIENLPVISLGIEMNIEFQTVFQWPFFNLEEKDHSHCCILKIFFMLKTIGFWMVVLLFKYSTKVWRGTLVHGETSALFTQEPGTTKLQESWENCQMKCTALRTRGNTFGETYNLSILVRILKKTVSRRCILKMTVLL